MASNLDLIHAALCLRGVVHDVNNRLGAALAYAELVGLDMDVQSDLHRMTVDIVEGVQRSTEILDTLATVTAVDPKVREEVDLAELLRATLRLYEYELKRLGVRYRVSTAESPVRVRVVRARIVRALVHVLRHVIGCLEHADRRDLVLTVDALENTSRVTLQCPALATTTETEGGISSDVLRRACEEVDYHQGTLRIEGDAIVITLPNEDRCR